LSHKGRQGATPFWSEANDHACTVMLTPGISCQAPQGGSIDGLGSDLQSLGINDLELVDQTGIAHAGGPARSAA
jgi:hypothetical protein